MPNSSKKSPLTPAVILFIHSSADLYGSDRALLSLLKNLDKQQFTPIVILPEQGKLTALLDQLHISYRIFPLSIFRKADATPAGILKFIFRFPSSVWRIYALAKKEHARIIHSNTAAIFPGACAALFARIPHIWHVREYLEIKNHPWLQRAYITMITKFSTKVIAVSSFIASQFPFSDKVTVVYDGIDSHAFNFNNFTDRSNAAANAVTNLKKHPDEFIIGNISRFNSFKGQCNLIKAFAQVNASFPQTRLVLIGDVFRDQIQYRTQIETQIAELGLDQHVDLYGHVDQVQPYLSQFDVFVMPSIHEPFGIACLEAMAASKPVIASNSGGLKEIITHTQDGLLCNPYDPTDFGQKLIELIHHPDLRASLATQARRTVTNRFTDQHAAEQIQHMYQLAL